MKIMKKTCKKQNYYVKKNKLTILTIWTCLKMRRIIVKKGIEPKISLNLSAEENKRSKLANKMTNVSSRSTQNVSYSWNK